MMQKQENPSLQAERIVKECFEQMRFARAAELARSRRYPEAQHILSPNGKMPSEPRELDLLARIAAKRKQFDQARRFWEEALRRVPGNDEFKHAIERAASAKRVRKFRQTVAFAVITAIAVAGLILIVLHSQAWQSLASRRHLKNTQSEATQPHPLPEKR
jgi:hypothetical protein